MVCTSHHIMPLVINSLGGGDTHIHTRTDTHTHTNTHTCTQIHTYRDVSTETILRNQVCSHGAPGLKRIVRKNNRRKGKQNRLIPSQ